MRSRCAPSSNPVATVVPPPPRVARELRLRRLRPLREPSRPQLRRTVGIEFFSAFSHRRIIAGFVAVSSSSTTPAPPRACPRHHCEHHHVFPISLLPRDVNGSDRIMILPYHLPYFFVGFGAERIMTGCGFECGLCRTTDTERRRSKFGQETDKNYRMIRAKT